MNHQALLGYRYMIVRQGDLDDYDFAQMKMTMPVNCYRSWDKAYQAAYTCIHLYYNDARLGGSELRTCDGTDALTITDAKKTQMKRHIDEGAYDVGFYVGKYGRPEFSVYISAVFEAGE